LGWEEQRVRGTGKKKKSFDGAMGSKIQNTTDGDVSKGDRK